MSLVAALLIGSSAFALENTKVSGSANLFYSTDDHVGLFDKESSMAQTSVGVGLTANLSDSVTTGVSLTALSTLGLEGQLVNGVFEGTNGVSDYAWFDEAWMATTVGKSTAKAGRMQLDTPLAFSETWSTATNTFEALVGINQDLPGTTLVGAYVGGSNGGDGSGSVIGQVDVNTSTNFSQFYNGAFALGAINNSYEPLTAQFWYYDATDVLTSYWLQADLDLDGIQVGVQYTGGETEGGTALSAYAAKVGYHSDTISGFVAYSQTGDEAGWGANLSGSGQSKLYTEAWWAYGYIAAQDTTAITAEVEYHAHGLGEFGLFYTTVSNANDATHDMQEITLTAAKSYGALDTTVALINETVGEEDAINMVQVYLTYNY